MRKRLICGIMAVISGILLGITAFGESAGFAVESGRVYEALAPYSKEYVQISWSSSESDTAGVPIPFGESVLYPSGHSVKKLAEKDGEEQGSVELSEKVSESCRGAVLGSVLVQPGKSSLFVINVDDMNIKISREFGEICTNIGILDNQVYFGIGINNGFKLICADLDDLGTVWEYESENPITSPALLNGYVIFGAGENLVARVGDEFAENPVGASITDIFAGQYAVFMSCGDGTLRKIRLDDDGQAAEDSLMSCEIGGTLTAPVEYKNRVYIGSSEGFFVLDGLNMEIAKSFPEMRDACSAVVCLGGAVRAYTAAPHADSSGDRWYLYAVLDDDDGVSAAEIAKIIDFTNGEIAVSESGSMYFRDAYGQLWTLKIAEKNVFLMVLKVVLTLGIIVMALVILSAWAKRRNKNKIPPVSC